MRYRGGKSPTRTPALVVETLAACRGRELSAEPVAEVPVGAGGIRLILAEHASATLRLAVLCDAGLQAQVRRGIDASGLDVSVFVCVADLEDAWIPAVGTDRTLAVLNSQISHTPAPGRSFCRQSTTPT